MDELEIMNQHDNRLLNRKEVKFKYTYSDKSPKRDEVKAKLVEKLRSIPEATVIIKMDNLFGHKVLDSVAHIYTDAKDATKFENRKLMKRNGLVKEEAKDQAKAEGA